jgi:hypothetical protein
MLGRTPKILFQIFLTFLIYFQIIFSIIGSCLKEDPNDVLTVTRKYMLLNIS